MNFMNVVRLFRVCNQGDEDETSYHIHAHTHNAHTHTHTHTHTSLTHFKLNP